MFSAATVAPVGFPSPTSRAKVGPERTATRGACAGDAPASSSVIRSSVPFSTPLARETRQASEDRCGAAFAATSRMWCEGTAKATTDLPETASARSFVGRTASGTAMPGRNARFSRYRRTASRTSSSRAQRATSP